MIIDQMNRIYGFGNALIDLEIQIQDDELESINIKKGNMRHISENELKTMDKEAINQLKEYDWSGNGRELRNVVERLIILSDNNKITKKDVIKYSNK